MSNNTNNYNPNNICLGCAYMAACGTPRRTVPCQGRLSKADEQKRAENLLKDLKGVFPDRNYAYASEMVAKGFGFQSIDLLCKYKLIETCNEEKGDVAYAW